MRPTVPTGCMATARLEAVETMKLAVARTFAWTLLLSGWLVLGSLGQLHLPLFAHGLFPVVLWLATAGVVFHLGQGVLVSGRAMRAVMAVLGLLVGACLLWATRGGGPLAVCSAAVGWGALLVAASRAVRLMRADRRPPPPVAPRQGRKWSEIERRRKSLPS